MCKQLNVACFVIYQFFFFHQFFFFQGLIHECLKNKFKKERKPLKDDTVNEMKTKFGRKRENPKEEETEDASLMKVKRATNATVSNLVLSHFQWNFEVKLVKLML